MSLGIPLWFWLAVAWLTVSYLALLGIVALVRPARAFGFLSGFAQTTAVNAMEAAARTLVGLALLQLEHHLGWRGWATLLGSFLIITAILMLLFPAQHRRLAPVLVGSIRPFIVPVGLASLALAGGLAVALGRI